jgi:hypothetical protein
VQDLWRPCGDRDLREAVKAENHAAVSKSVSKSPAARGLRALTWQPPIGVEPMTYITRVSRCVAHKFKARASFKFAGSCWWRSLGVDGRSRASRGTRP